MEEAIAGVAAVEHMIKRACGNRSSGAWHIAKP
jgi:hypothetical protein